MTQKELEKYMINDLAKMVMEYTTVNIWINKFDSVMTEFKIKWHNLDSKSVWFIMYEMKLNFYEKPEANNLIYANWNRWVRGDRKRLLADIITYKFINGELRERKMFDLYGKHL